MTMFLITICWVTLAIYLSKISHFTIYLIFFNFYTLRWQIWLKFTLHDKDPFTNTFADDHVMFQKVYTFLKGEFIDNFK